PGAPLMDRETEQAMAWLQALKSTAPGQEEAFVDWVRASPAHLQEFVMAAAVNEELGALDCSAMPGVEAALHRATSNVNQLPAAHAERPALARARRPRWRRAACAAAVAAGVALWWLPDGQTYRTAIG